MNRTIEEVRKAKGFTQEQVAKGVGIGASTLNASDAKPTRSWKEATTLRRQSAARRTSTNGIARGMAKPPGFAFRA